MNTIVRCFAVGTAVAALAGGVAGGLVSLATSHTVGLVISLLVFAASCGGYDPERDERDAAATA